MAKLTIPQIVKKILPAVVSITISKYLTIFETPFGPSLGPGPSSGRSPFGGSGFAGPLGFDFEQFFAIPKGKKKIKLGGGSGFIIDPSGIILTNRHVLADPRAEYLVILTDDKKYQGRVIARDPINDVAILKINAQNLPSAELGDSSKLELGQTAIAIGNVLGTFRNTVSTGVVSGLSREIKAGSTLSGEITRLRGLIQTDAAINPGNSGGPLLDEQGRVIGINVATVFLAENIGFALPINTAKKDLEEVRKYGRIRQPFLGVRYVLLNKNLQEKYALPSKEGALVISEPIPEGQAVVPGGPADKAGIKEGDVILAIDKEKISAKKPLIDILNDFKTGDKIELTILRDGRETTFKTILGEKK